MVNLRRVMVLGLLLVAVVSVQGCAGKKKGAHAGAQPGMTEEGVAPGGSLGEFRSGGTLPRGEGGPMPDVHFAFDSYQLDPQATDVLRQTAGYLKDHSGEKVEIEGHCDERGTIEYNLALGAKRARAAKDYLVTLGIDPERLTTISYGEELPLCTEHNETCWAQNRRAHFVPLRD